MTTPSFPKPLSGIIPPLITPLSDRDRLDAAGLQRLLERVITGGVHGVFILGTSGEGPSLSYRLRREVIAQTCRQVAGRVPVLVGITDTSVIKGQKCALALLGVCDDFMAEPFHRFREPEREQVRQILMELRMLP